MLHPGLGQCAQPKGSTSLPWGYLKWDLARGVHFLLEAMKGGGVNEEGRLEGRERRGKDRPREGVEGMGR